ncbi:MAG: sialate O-acetylesterase [Verrucomicrobiales bacterium]|nr:sialate O-acetylesterase [Verrucomicrobiales bacterium]MCP5559658.1 sialate O-acetylesterase [Verrucomicrobiaceae bacterium]
MKRLPFLLCLLATTLASLNAADTVELPAKEKFHLYLLIGQSNMAGRGTVEAQDKVPHPRVLMQDKTGAWVPAVDPLHSDKTAAGVGLGKSFGIAMAENDPSVTIGLIPCAHGGSPIDAWQPGVFYPPTKGHPWDDMVKHTHLALEHGVLKGILWHQGESDSGKPETANAYEGKFHDLIQRVRTEFKAPDVPFVCGQMGIFSEKPWSADKKRVDKAHRDLPSKVPHTGFANAEGFHHRGDSVHFDSASYREFGKRYAAEMIRLQAAR